MMKLIKYSTFIVILILTACFVHADETKNRCAVIIGVEKYENFSTLRSAKNDAIKMAGFFKKAGYEKVVLLDTKDYNTVITKDRVIDNLKQIAQDFQNTLSEFVFFFAGHGVNSGTSSYLCLPDSTVEDPSSMISVEGDLLTVVEEIGADLSFFMLDACRTMIHDYQDFKVFTGPLNPDKSLIILYAASPGASSYESKDGTGSYFTRVILDSFMYARPGLSGIVDYVTTFLPSITLTEYGVSQIPSISGNFNPSLPFSVQTANESSENKTELIIQTKPSGALVYIGEVYVGTTPLVYTKAFPGTLHIRAVQDNLVAEKEIYLKAGINSIVDLELSDPQGKLFFATDIPIVSVFIDGQDSTENLHNNLLILKTGVHTIKLIAEDNLFWEGEFDVQPSVTQTLYPDFKPYGTLEITIPKGAIIHITSIDNGTSYICTDSERNVIFPAGRYLYENIDERFLTNNDSFTLEKGAVFHLTPIFSFTPYGALMSELEEYQEKEKEQRAFRKTLHTMNIVSLSAGALSALGTGISYLFFRSACNSYNSAELGADFKTLRGKVQTTQAVYSIFGCVSLGLGVVSGITFVIKPDMEKTRDKIKEIKLQINELEMLSQ